MGIGTRGLVSCPGGSATWYSIENLTQAVSGQKKISKNTYEIKNSPAAGLRPAAGRICQRVRLEVVT